MFNPRKKKPISSQTGAIRSTTPLDRRQEDLRAKEEQLKNAAAELQRLIEEAPRIREEQTRRRRAMLASDTRLTNKRPPRPVYQHNSIMADPAAVEQKRSQAGRSGMLKFIGLLLLLLGTLLWVGKMAMTNLLR